MRPVVEDKHEDKEGDSSQDYQPEVAEWRYGPAQYWYDMLGVDSSGEGFNYGYKPKEEDEQVMFILVRHAGGGQLRGRI